MKMRFRALVLLLAAAALGAAALLVPGALAANQSVVAKVNNTFVPRDVAVKPGETVTFTNEDGEHNVVWTDGTPAAPPQAVLPSAWPPGGVTRTFTRSGRYRYFCEIHGDRTGLGMAGNVYVNSVGLIPPRLASLTATANRSGVRVTFRSSRAGRARAVFFRKVGRRYVRDWSSTFAARRGLTNKRIPTTLEPDSYRVEVQVTDANRLASEKSRRNFRVR